MDGIFIAFYRTNGQIDNAWFYGAVDCVRWLLAFAHDIDRIVILRHG